jgi:hypothetical protein
MLLKRFAERGVKPAEVTDLLLTHSHLFQTDSLTFACWHSPHVHL